MYYYLHENGSLIFKPSADPQDFQESTFVRRYWEIDTTNRTTAWRIVVESLALDADEDRVLELIKKWDCSVQDIHFYLSRETITPERRKGVKLYLELMGGYSYSDKYFNWLASTPKGQEPDMSTLPELEGVDV